MLPRNKGGVIPVTVGNTTDLSAVAKRSANVEIRSSMVGQMADLASPVQFFDSHCRQWDSKSYQACLKH